MSTWKRPVFYLLNVCLVVTSGCRATGSHVQRVDDPACLVAEVPIWVYAIDGRKVSQIGFTGEKRFFIEPGTHVITVRYSSLKNTKVVVDGELYQAKLLDRMPKLAPVKFEAMAGRTYYLHGGEDLTVWNPHVTESRNPTFQEIQNP